MDNSHGKQCIIDVNVTNRFGPFVVMSAAVMVASPVLRIFRCTDVSTRSEHLFAVGMTLNDSVCVDEMKSFNVL